MKFNTINKIIMATFVASTSAYDLLKDFAGDLKVGVAANSQKFNNGNYNNALKAFNIMVAENACKVAGIQGQQGVYNFRDCDAHYNKAKELGMEFRGHCLVWHSMPPPWYERADANTLKNAIVDHVTKVLQHYEGKIKAWDVVNEAIDDSSNGQGFKMRNSFLYQRVPNFVDLAFQTARKVSPNTKLFYNDYNAEGQSPKSESIYNFVADLKKRNIPIDGVGLQYHVASNNQPSFDKINNLIGRYCKLGLEVHITELDVKLQGNQNGQTQAYTNALKACLGNSCCKAFLVWGVGDNDSWLGANEKALLFDGNYQPKGIYNSLLSVLKSSARPASNTGNTDAGNANAGNSNAGNANAGNANAGNSSGNKKGKSSKTIPASLITRTKTVPGNLISKTKTVPESLKSNTKTIPASLAKNNNTPKTKTIPAVRTPGAKVPPSGAAAGSSSGGSKTIPPNLLNRTKTLPGESGAAAVTGKKTKTVPSSLLNGTNNAKKTKVIPESLRTSADGSSNVSKKTKTVPESYLTRTKTVPESLYDKPKTNNASGSLPPKKTKTNNVSGSLPPKKTKTVDSNVGKKTKTIPDNLLVKTTKAVPDDYDNAAKTIPDNLKTTAKAAPENVSPKSIPENLKKTTKTVDGNLGKKTKTVPENLKTKNNGGSNASKCDCTATVTVTVTANNAAPVAFNAASADGAAGGNCVAKWGQCGGSGYSGATCCESGSTCKQFNEWYSQCV